MYFILLVEFSQLQINSNSNSFNPQALETYTTWCRKVRLVGILVHCKHLSRRRLEIDFLEHGYRIVEHFRWVDTIWKIFCEIFLVFGVRLPLAFWQEVGLWVPNDSCHFFSVPKFLVEWRYLQYQVKCKDGSIVDKYKTTSTWSLYIGIFYQLRMRFMGSCVKCGRKYSIIHNRYYIQQHQVTVYHGVR